MTPQEEKWARPITIGKPATSGLDVTFAELYSCLAVAQSGYKKLMLLTSLRGYVLSLIDAFADDLPDLANPEF